jgi:hypothetical protein
MSAIPSGPTVTEALGVADGVSSALGLAASDGRGGTDEMAGDGAN